jgi:hypothetical protein
MCAVSVATCRQIARGAAQARSDSVPCATSTGEAHPFAPQSLHPFHNAIVIAVI